MTDIKQFVTPDNLGPDFEQDATAKEIKVNIDGVTLIRNAEGKLEAAGGGDSKVYNISELPEGATAPVATRDNALAAGDGAVASGLNSVAIGINANASGIQSTALGANAVASGLQSTAFGYNANTTKSRQVSIAPLSETTHLSSNPRLLSGVKEPEVGQDAANKDYVDDLTKVDGTTITRNAVGELEATGASKEYVDDLTAIDGTTIIRNAEGELEGTGASKEYVDDLTAIDGTTIIRNAEGELVAVDDSVDYNLTELPDGATAPVATGDNALAAGAGAEASGLNGIAIGNGANGYGNNSLAIGVGAQAPHPQSVAIGLNSNANALSSVAIGISAVASEIHSTALGGNTNTTKTGQVSIALLDETTHLSTHPRILSGVKAPEVGQDAANKNYVDNYIKAKVAALPAGATLAQLINALKS